tara:strand:- start:12 stop:575 length:564 start_codon:yes stop_codon:yes gene_type:complete
MNPTNHFLLALPTLHEDYFAASLTYICEHSDDGAVGIVVNRPSNISVLELLNQLNLNPQRHWVDHPVIAGGPVSTDRGFVLFAGAEAYESSLTVADGVHLTSAFDSLRAVANDEGPEKFMIALGYAGWGLNVGLLRSSGHQALDAAALKTVRQAAPYQPFNVDMRKRYDELTFTRTWQFSRSGSFIN